MVKEPSVKQHLGSVLGRLKPHFDLDGDTEKDSGEKRVSDSRSEITQSSTKRGQTQHSFRAEKVEGHCISSRYGLRAPASKSAATHSPNRYSRAPVPARAFTKAF